MNLNLQANDQVLCIWSERYKYYYWYSYFAVVLKSNGMLVNHRWEADEHSNSTTVNRLKLFSNEYNPCARIKNYPQENKE